MRKLDDAKKRKKFPLWLSEGERLLLEAKAEEYQYKYLADYIRDGGYYEAGAYRTGTSFIQNASLEP